MTRKALASIGCGPMEKVLAVARPTFERFADRHGYDLFLSTTSHSEGRPESWGKTRLMRQLLDDYDVVLWVDADAIILDDSEDPSELLAPDDYQALALLHPLDQELPCCAVWLMRSTERAKSFLDLVWTMDQYLDDRFWEQAAVLDLLGYSVHPSHLIAPTEWMVGTCLLGEEWNRMPLTTRELAPCRIRHYGGESNAVRCRQMRRDRHELEVRRTQGWERTWHQAAAAAGLVSWRLWDGPSGTFGAYHRLWYRGANWAYDLAQRAGLVTIVRARRGRLSRG